MSFVEHEAFRKSHFSLKYRFVSSISSQLQWVTYRSRHGITKGLRRRGGLGFLPRVFAGAATETAEVQFLRDLPLEKSTVYDIGSFHGLMAMFFSTKAQEVIAYEPNPENRERLSVNLRLNGIEHVSVRPIALGAKSGKISLVWDPSMAGAGTADQDYREQIKSSVGGFREIEVLVRRLDEDIREQ